MNSLAIKLNNEAVDAMRGGDMLRAYDMMTKACQVTAKAVAEHTHEDPSSNIPFRFHWVDCVASSKMEHSTSQWEGSSSFLFLRTLKVSLPEDVDIACPCGFAWSVWFNMAICCSLLGTRLSERGRNLLKTAFDMYRRVQNRIDSEPSSKHWTILHMAVTNNVACIYHDFAMREDTRKCFRKLAQALGSASCVDSRDRHGFLLNMHILCDQRFASAA